MDLVSWVLGAVGLLVVAALAVVLGALRRTWPQADVRLGADLTTTAPRGAAELAVRLRPERLVPGVARVGWASWRERRRSRRDA